MFTLYANEKEYPIYTSNYPDNTLLCHLPAIKVNSVKWNYENDAELFTLICIRKHYSQHNISLILPYIPHARMDRVKVEEDVFTLKYFCEVINSLNFDKVYVLDAHSNVSLALLNNVVQEDVYKYIEKTIKLIDKKDLVLFFPDEGAMKRYSADLKLPYAFGIKRRDWKTGEIQSLDIINKEILNDKKVLIIDDICSRGGTFLHSARALKEVGADKVYLYVTHAEPTMAVGEMYNTPELVEEIYTTDSLFKKSSDILDKVVVLDAKALI